MKMTKKLEAFFLSNESNWLSIKSAWYKNKNHYALVQHTKAGDVIVCYSDDLKEILGFKTEPA